MRKITMPDAKFSSRGFTLIASLLLLLLLSGFSIALLMMVNTEQQAGGHDLNNTYVYRTAEGAMEKMTSDLANTFQNIQSPTANDICSLSTNPGPPTWDTTVSYPLYTITPIPVGSSNPCTSALTTVWGPINSGPDSGLYAQLIPVSMNVQAQRNSGEYVSMTRTAEVALIPVFQFGAFSDSDLFFGQSPNLGFAGRVHTNGDLYLGVANGYNLVFGDKMSAFGNVIREQMDNGLAVGGGLDDGTVLIPTTSNGCATQLTALQSGGSVTASATCVNIANNTNGLGATAGSVLNGHGSSQNLSTWQNVSKGTYNSYLIDGNGPTAVCTTCDGPNNTGATDLILPFVNGTTSAAQIIRRPLTTTAPSSLLGGSQLGYEAQIRILLSDTQAGLHLADWNGDSSQDIQLVGAIPTALAGLNQGASSGGSQAGAVNVAGSNHYYYFGESYCGGTAAIAGTIGNPCPTTNGGDNNFVIPKYYGPMSTWPPLGSFAPTAFPAATTTIFTTGNGSATTNGLEWPLVNGWLLVEANWASDGAWHGVTKEWLKLGFARGLNVPVQPGLSCTPPSTNTLSTAQGCNYLADHANAILYFQVTADRNLSGSTSGSDLPVTANYYDTTSATHGSQYNWYPINLYDAREGENNDNSSIAGSFPQTGTPNGLLNAVELDVGNLRNWLLGKTGTTGTQVDFATQNGYILYFSDRRGMQFASSCGTIPCTTLYGEYGFEDTVNFANAGANYAPDGRLDGNNYNNVSPEDVNGNGRLDNYGVKGIGGAFGTTFTNDTDTVSPPTPFAHRFSTITTGLANRVTGARHVLKLVDGSLGYLPTMPPGNATNNCLVPPTAGATSATGCGGFTVAAENPIYIQGNYNSNCPSAGSAGCTPKNTNYDPTWTSTIATEPSHAAASIITDAFTFLSNNWQDAGCAVNSGICATNTPQNIGTFYNTTGSLVNPVNSNTNPGSTPNRMAATTYYRAAVAAGKTIAFNNTSGAPDTFFGSDGGVHNFLRFLEDWSVPGSSGNQLQSLYYKGSIVSLYWNAYATGTFKCCNLVYHPPNRQYSFDPLFSIPQNLPPGTPMFRNVDNLSYRQNQIARTN
jgi:Tfp pilus assembly protein PilX